MSLCSHEWLLQHVLRVQCQMPQKDLTSLIEHQLILDEIVKGRTQQIISEPGSYVKEMIIE